MSPATRRMFPLLMLCACAIVVGAPGLIAADDDSTSPAPAKKLTVGIKGEILHANTVEFAGLTFRDVVGVPQLSGKILSFHDCRATAYGGTVGGEVALDLGTDPSDAASSLASSSLPPPATTPTDAGIPAGAATTRLPPLPAAPAPVDATRQDPEYHCTIQVNGLDLGTILHEFGGNSAGITGTIDGTIELTIPVVNPQSAMSGRGEIHVTNGSLIQLPLLANLFLGDPGGGRGHDAFNATFDLRDGKIRLLNATLDSPSIAIAIRGTVGLDGDLALYLDPSFKFGILKDIPGLGPIVVPLLTKVQRRVTRALVRGQITKPVLIINPFIKAE